MISATMAEGQRGGVLRPTGRTAAGRKADRDRRVNRQRAWLADAIERRDMTLADVGRFAGVQANGLTNFLKGRSNGFDQRTVAAIDTVFPGFARMMGDTAPLMRLSKAEERQLREIERLSATVSVGAMERELQAVRHGDVVELEDDAGEVVYVPVPVRHEARPLTWRKDGHMPIEDRELLVLPLPPYLAALSPFGLRVGDAAGLYDDGTLLVCVKPEPDQVQPGRRVVVTRRTPTTQPGARGRVEVTVREVEGRRGGMDLVGGGAKREPLPDDFHGERWSRRGEKLEVIGLVALACRPDAGQQLSA